MMRMMIVVVVVKVLDFSGNVGNGNGTSKRIWKTVGVDRIRTLG